MQLAEQPSRDTVYPSTAYARLTQAYDQEMTQVNETIVEGLEKRLPFIQQVSQHLIMAGGKRIRPLLLLMVARLFRYHGKAHISLAACIEYFHTATLLHDDVIDDSEERRGLETANVLWGNKPTILVGDFLFSRAFELMVQSNDLEILQVLSQAASCITEGELLQLTQSGDIEMGEVTYTKIIEAKTAALFQAATEVGALLGGANQAEREAARTFGGHIGNIFQLLDDVLDYGIGAHNLGKAYGDDFYEGKVTLPVILAYDNGNEAEKAFWKECFQGKNTRTPKAFHRAVALIQKYEVPRLITARAHALKSRAEQALNTLPDRHERSELVLLLDHCMGRCS